MVRIDQRDERNPCPGQDVGNDRRHLLEKLKFDGKIDLLLGHLFRILDCGFGISIVIPNQEIDTGCRRCLFQALLNFYRQQDLLGKVGKAEFESSCASG